MMLSDLEARLVDALRRALPNDVPLSAGPPSKPESSLKGGVGVFVPGFQAMPPDTEDRETRREAAFLSQRYDLSGDGRTLDFSLPDDALGELAEVELGPGRLARPGDQCWLEGKVLRFYRAPTGPFHVVLRGDRALGYLDTVRATVNVELTVLDDQLAPMDELTSTALTALLSTFVDLDFVPLAQARAPALSIRLLKPHAEIHSMVRDAVDAGSTRLFRTTTRIALNGDLETTLVSGIAEDVHGRIERVEGALQVATGNPHTRTFTVARKGDTG